MNLRHQLTTVGRVAPVRSGGHGTLLPLSAPRGGAHAQCPMRSLPRPFAACRSAPVCMYTPRSVTAAAGRGLVPRLPRHSHSQQLGRGDRATVRLSPGGIVPLGYDFLTFLATTVLVVPTCKSLRISPVLGFLGAGVLLEQLGCGSGAALPPPACNKQQLSAAAGNCYLLLLPAAVSSAARPPTFSHSPCTNARPLPPGRHNAAAACSRTSRTWRR